MCTTGTDRMTAKVSFDTTNTELQQMLDTNEKLGRRLGQSVMAFNEHSLQDSAWTMNQNNITQIFPF